MFGSSNYPLTSSLLVLAVYLYIDVRLATDIFKKELKNISSVLLGMSVFLGLYAFGI
jgi:hypothetical protein